VCSVLDVIILLLYPQGEEMMVVAAMEGEDHDEGFSVVVVV